MLRQRIAVVTDWPFSSVYHEGLERGIDSYACAQGFEVIHFAVGSFNSQKQFDRIRERLFELISPQAFAGLIILTPTMCNLCSRARLAEEVAKLKPLPMIGLADSLCGEPYLKTSSGPGFVSLLKHLIYDHGYRHFCYVSGPYGNREAEERLFLYRQTLAEAGIKSDPLNEYIGGFVFEDGREAVRVFWDERRLRPEVIVCANDGMALGAWQELKERRLNVPCDVALTGFDEIRLSDYFSLQLTTVRQPIYEEGLILAQAIQALITGNALPSLEPLATEVVIRHSCGCHKVVRKNFYSSLRRSGLQLKASSEVFNATLEGFGKALSLSVPKAELRKLWDRLVLQGAKEKIEQEVLLEVVAKIREGLWDCSLKGIKPSLQELNELAEEMLEILLDVYAQSDLIGRHERTEITEAMR